jgi:hypothetical protein
MSVHNFRINFSNMNGGTKEKIYDIFNECIRKEIDVFGLAHINTKNMKDKIPYEILKLWDDEVLESVRFEMNLWMIEKKIPKNWKEGKMILL